MTMETLTIMMDAILFAKLNSGIHVQGEIKLLKINASIFAGMDQIPLVLDVMTEICLIMMGKF